MANISLSSSARQGVLERVNALCTHIDARGLTIVKDISWDIALGIDYGVHSVLHCGSCWISIVFLAKDKKRPLPEVDHGFLMFLMVCRSTATAMEWLCSRRHDGAKA